MKMCTTLKSNSLKMNVSKKNLFERISVVRSSTDLGHVTLKSFSPNLPPTEPGCIFSVVNVWFLDYHRLQNK